MANNPTPIYTPETIDACIADCKFEIKMRHGVFSKKVHAGTMTRAAMDKAIKTMTDTITYLEHLKRILTVAKLGLSEGGQSKLF